jgi:Fe-S-cluster containining protein
MAKSIRLSPWVEHAAPDLQELWADQFLNWTAFLKKAASHVARGSTKWRTKIQVSAEKEIDRTRAAYSRESPLACQKGCAHCCHFNVEINVLEAEPLADRVRRLPEDQREATVQRLKAAHETLLRTGPLRHRHPCPFLVDNECSVYDDRPLSCRSHVSVAVAFCITEFQTEKAVLSEDDPEVDPTVLQGNFMWHILLRSVTDAAGDLIGSAGTLSAAVLEKLDSTR